MCSREGILEGDICATYLPVVTQAATLDELAANIREAIGLHLEGEDLANLGFSNGPTILATMELEAVA